MEEYKETLIGDDLISFQTYLNIIENQLAPKNLKCEGEEEIKLLDIYKANSTKDYLREAVANKVVEKVRSLYPAHFPVTAPKQEIAHSEVISIKQKKMNDNLNYAPFASLSAFNGTDWSSWEINFENVLYLMSVRPDGTEINISDKVKLALLKTKISSEVSNDLAHRHWNAVGTYAELSEMLRECYTKKVLSDVELRTKLINLKRGNSDIESFLREIENLACRAHLSSPAASRKALIIAEITGKFDANLQRDVINNGLKEVEEVIEFIVEYENVGKNMENKRNVHKNKNQRSNVQNSSSTTYENPNKRDSKIKCEFCGKPNHTEDICYKKHGKPTIAAINPNVEVKRCFAYGNVNGIKKQRVFFDVGACNSFISNHLAEKLIKYKGLIKNKEDKVNVSWGVPSQSNRVNVSGSLQVNILFKKIIYPLKLYITGDKMMRQEINCDILLGADSYDSIGTVAKKFSERYICLNLEKINMLNYSSLQNLHSIIKINEDVKGLHIENPEFDLKSKEAKEFLLDKYPILKDEERLGCCTISCPDPFVIPHSEPPKFKRYKFNTAQQTQINNFTDKLEEMGIIEVSNTNYISSPMVVPKPNSNEGRPVVDLSDKNHLFEPHRFPSPTFREITKHLSSAKIYSKLDLNQAFHQIPVSKTFSRYLGIWTHKGCRWYVRMPQGYRNASAVFQMILQQILGHLEGVIIYIDDILIFTVDDWSLHLQLIDKVIGALLDHNMSLNLSKCIFGSTKLTYLGFMIGSQGTSINEIAVAPLLNRKFPQSKKELRSFIFAANFYNQFVMNFALIAKPLTDMLSTKVKLREGPLELAAFENLKSAIALAPTLAHPVSGEEFYIESDSSLEGMGAQLYQWHDINGIKQKVPIAFMSKKLSAKSKILPPGYLELRAIITAVRTFEIYIQNEHTTIFTDHKILVTLFSTTQNPILLRWIAEIASFNVSIKYLPGKLNGFADYLSRSKSTDTYEEEVEINAQHPQRLIPINAIVENDKPIVPDYLYKLTKDVKVVHDEIFLQLPINKSFKWVKFIPPEEEIEVATRYHSLGHFHPDKAIKHMKRQVYFPCMLTTLKQVYSKCLPCSKVNKSKKKGTAVKMALGSTYPFQHLAVDISGPFTQSRLGNKYLLNTICQFSKFVVSIALPNTTSSTIINSLRQHVFAIFNVPEQLRCDNAKCFTSKEFQMAMEMEGINLEYSVPYYSKSNCLVERSFRTCQEMIAKLITERKLDRTDWDSILHYVIRYYNAAVHESTNESPYFIVFLRDPHHLGWIENTTFSNYADYVDDGMKLMKEAYDMISKFNLNIRMKSKIVEDMKQTPPPQVQKDDLIMVQMPSRDKFAGDYQGPFKVIRLVGNVVHYRRTNRSAASTCHITKIKLFESTLKNIKKLKGGCEE